MWAQAIAAARAELSAAGVASPQTDARELAEFIHGSRPDPRAIPDAAELAAYREIVARRAARIPLQHLTGRMYFRYLELLSGPGALIVHPETELVAGAAIAEVCPGDLVVDLGTGSGAIALAVATETKARVIGVDISPAALEIAAANNSRYADVVELVHGDALTALAHLLGKVDVVVTNPPYVSENSEIDQEVRHDPELALFSPAAGLEIPRRFLARAWELLRPGGLVFMEHAADQGPALAREASALGFVQASTHQDLTGRDRWLRARKDIREG